MAVRDKTPFEVNNVYFITFTLGQWQNIFTEKKYLDLIYKWFDYQKETYQNKIHGYVIMPNHFHGLLFISEYSPPLSKLIQNAKRFLAYQIVKYLHEDQKNNLLLLFADKAQQKKGAKHKVFEERYDSKVIDSEQLYLEKLNYIHNNPCAKHWKLAKSPEEYLYSSARNYLAGQGIYPVDILT